MKRRLIVMRHAKSSWANSGLTDHQRPLNKRGKRDAPRVGIRIEERGWIPDLILSSDSQRTRETSIALTSTFSKPISVEYWREFYLAGISAVVPVVSQVDGDVSVLMILGHNPGWEHVVYHLAGVDVVMKTATAALLELDAVDWNQAIRSSGDWSLTEVIYPRELED